MVKQSCCERRTKKSSPSFYGRYHYNKKVAKTQRSRKRAGAGNGKNSGMLASIQTVLQISKRNQQKDLPVPRPGQRSAADSRQTKLPRRRYRPWARRALPSGSEKKITGKGFRSGREAADFSGKQYCPKKTAAGNDRQGVQNSRA